MSDYLTLDELLAEEAPPEAPPQLAAPAPVPGLPTVEAPGGVALPEGVQVPDDVQALLARREALAREIDILTGKAPAPGEDPAFLARFPIPKRSPRLKGPARMPSLQAASKVVVPSSLSGRRLPSLRLAPPAPPPKAPRLPPLAAGAVETGPLSTPERSPAPASHPRPCRQAALAVAPLSVEAPEMAPHAVAPLSVEAPETAPTSGIALSVEAPPMAVKPPQVGRPLPPAGRPLPPAGTPPPGDPRRARVQRAPASAISANTEASITVRRPAPMSVAPDLAASASSGPPLARVSVGAQGVKGEDPPPFCGANSDFNLDLALSPPAARGLSLDRPNAMPAARDPHLCIDSIRSPTAASSDRVAEALERRRLERSAQRRAGRWS